MTPQELKNSILQRAIEGKLVEQRKEEGTGAELLEIIFEEVNSFVKLNSIRKNNKHIKTENNEDDFEIPENWGKVKLGEICFLLNGKKETNKSYPYLEVKYLRGNIEPKIKTSGKVVSANTNIILMDGENSGEVFKTSETGYLGSTLKILYIPEILSEKFYLYFLLLNKNYLRDNKKGAAIPHLDKEVFFNLNFPIPPLAEQKRIVEKIEEIMPLVDKYEKNWQKLEELNKKFPEDMKKSLLQEAIKGKLVEQRPEEGTGEELFDHIQEEKNKLVKERKIKKQKDLPKITEDEIPFDIPENWKWVRLGDVFSLNMGQSPKGSSVNRENEGVEFHQGKVMFGSKFLMKSDQKTSSPTKIAEENSILLCVRAPVGKVNISPRKICIGRGLCSLNSNNINLDFSYYLLVQQENSFNKKSTGTTFKAISKGIVSNQLIPLPPLKEQERIVDKLDEMLPYCDELLKII